MRLRISEVTDGPTTVLHVDGELTGEGARELERVAAGHSRLTLDLTHLHRADADGLAALRQLAAAGARLEGATPYIALLLAASRHGC